MKKLLILGGSGLLGINWALRRRFVDDVHIVLHERHIFIDKVTGHKVDSDKSEQLLDCLFAIQPEVIVNAAGYTDVDACDRNVDNSAQTNRELAIGISKIATKIGSKFIQISTDHLFDGSKPFSDEQSNPKPLNSYAQHKLDAEIGIKRECPNAIICRTNFTGWGPTYRRSFSDLILDKLKLGITVNIQDDVFFTPISCSQLIDTAHALIDAGSTGVFNICNNERISKYEFAVRLAESFGCESYQIQPVQAWRKKTATQRPKDLSLSNKKVRKELGIDGFTISETIHSLKSDEVIREEILTIGKIIPYGKHYIDEDDVVAVSNVLRFGQLTQGTTISTFEQNIAAFVGSKYAVAVSSATAGLHLSYLALGLKSGSSVLTSPITFVSTSNAAYYCGGHVHFTDINAKTINMCPDKLERKLGDVEDILIVAPVHFAGSADGMDEIFDIAKSHNKFIVEDAAHSLGGRYHCGAPVGSCKYSDCTVFSLHPVKSIAAGEGGVVTTNDEDIFKQLLRLRSHGINKGMDKFAVSKQAVTEGKKNPWYYEMQYLGYNYRITDIQTALADSQLRKLNTFQSHRRALARRYSKYFENYKFASQAQLVDLDKSANHLFLISIDFHNLGITRANLMSFLQNAGIFTQVHYIPVVMHPFYIEKGFTVEQYPLSVEYYSNALSLPIYPSLTFAEQDFVLEKLHIGISELINASGGANG